jgi:hypothetical protein
MVLSDGTFIIGLMSIMFLLTTLFLTGSRETLLFQKNGCPLYFNSSQRCQLDGYFWYRQREHVRLFYEKLEMSFELFVPVFRSPDRPMTHPWYTKELLNLENREAQAFN